MINPDLIKEEMARRGLMPTVDGLTPMEASDLAHEESSHIAKRLATRAQADGKNVIWDITMAKTGSIAERVESLRAAGYSEVDGVFVDIPVEVSVRRADARYREGHDEFRAGQGIGGRYVPEATILKNADAEWGSGNRRNFEQLKSTFDSWRRYDNSVDDRDPVLGGVAGTFGTDKERCSMSGNEVIDLMDALTSGELSLDEVAARFRQRRWARTRGPVARSYAEMADLAQLDPGANVPGSIDDVTAAYDRGEITREQYRTLAHAVADAINSVDRSSD